MRSPSSDREKVDGLVRQLARAEGRIAELERDLAASDQRLRVLFGDLGRQRRQLEPLARRLEVEAETQLALDAERDAIEMLAAEQRRAGNE